MELLTSPSVLKELLARHGFRFSKSLGQNFLIDQNIIDIIVKESGIFDGDRVLEIGPGAGTLTVKLAQCAGFVVAVEKDRTLLPILDETLAGFSNVCVIPGDILKVDLHEIARKYFDNMPFKVVGNLPYYITTPIIMRFLEEEGLHFESITVMLQKEVARRIMAKPGTKDYGVLSVAVQYHAVPHFIRMVPRTVFMPPPAVDSAVVVLKKRESPPVFVKDKDLFFKTVRAAFARRRKTLVNSLLLAKIVECNRKDILKMLEELEIDPRRRGETLSIEEFARIANALAG